MTVRFECVTAVAAAPERVYTMSLDVGLHLRSTARSRERAVGGVTEGVLGLGGEVTWRAWHFGPLGRLAEVVVVGRYLRRLIEQRNHVLAAEAATPG